MKTEVKTIMCDWCGRDFKPEKQNELKIGRRIHYACDFCLGLKPPEPIPNKLGFDPLTLWE